VNQPSISSVPDKDLYVVDDDFVVKLTTVKIVVPCYFLTDGASVPKACRPFTYEPFHPRVMAAAVTHDWLYHTHQVDREQADKIFYDLMIINHANQVKARLMYEAVRRFGGWYWDNDPDDIVKLAQLYCLARKSPRFQEYHFPEIGMAA